MNTESQADLRSRPSGDSGLGDGVGRIAWNEER